MTEISVDHLVDFLTKNQGRHPDIYFSSEHTFKFFRFLVSPVLLRSFLFFLYCNVEKLSCSVRFDYCAMEFEAEESQ
jgi:hypothetical protein